MNKIVICPGSFDPVTRGHVEIIRRAAKMFDHVIVAVLVNSAKKPCFSTEERIELLEKAVGEIENVEVSSFEGLLANYCKQRKADAVVRGLRAVTDFEYEFQMALTNKKLNPHLETVFLTADADSMYLSSSMVREVASMGGDISNFVPACICDRISEHLNNKPKDI